MPITLFERNAAEEKKTADTGSSIVTGTVINNCDLIMQGKVLVRIPSLGQEVWARLAGVGAGSGAGFFYAPRVDDEVLVGLNQNKAGDAYILAGLWNTQDQPPASTPVDVIAKRVIKTGLKGGIGHAIEMDDTLQSVTITTSTKQQITLDPKKIELSTALGTLKITLDLTQQSISIQAQPPVGTIEFKAGQIKLSAAKIDISATAQASLKSQGDCVVSGTMVRIN